MLMRCQEINKLRKIIGFEPDGAAAGFTGIITASHHRSLVTTVTSCSY
jgi:hypothetical protein